MLFILLINWEISWNHLFISNDTVQATAYADTEWVVNPALLPPETKSVALTLRVKLVQLLRFGMEVCRNARCTSFLFITIQICSFSLSCDLLKISLIYVFPASKNSSCKLIKQSNQPVHTFFCQFCTHLFYIEGNG